MLSSKRDRQPRNAIALTGERLGIITRWVGGIGLAIALTSCNSIITDRYEATALTTYTWQVEYPTARASDRSPRTETFASTSVLNRNGVKPEGAVLEDDRGIWWPGLPPRPTVEEIERRQQPTETAGTPQLLKNVKYELTYQLGDRQVTKPTNYQVYREVAKAYPERPPLKFVLGAGDATVDRVESQ